MKRIVPEKAMIIPAEAERVFTGVLFDVYQWQQKLFDGSFETFERLRRQDTVFVIAIQDGRFVVLDQLQPDWHEPKTGLIAGRVDPGESTLEAAQRETREEAGLEFADWQLLDVYQPESKMEWFVYLYLATHVTATVEPHLDGGEQITSRLVDWAELKRLATPGNMRMQPAFLGRINSVEALLDWPEFQGREVELRDK